jgi:hypothetical protein
VQPRSRAHWRSGKPGVSVASATGSHPERHLFGQATPGLHPTPTATAPAGKKEHITATQKNRFRPLTQRGFVVHGMALAELSAWARPERVLCVPATL